MYSLIWRREQGPCVLFVCHSMRPLKHATRQRLRCLAVEGRWGELKRPAAAAVHTREWPDPRGTRGVGVWMLVCWLLHLRGAKLLPAFRSYLMGHEAEQAKRDDCGAKRDDCGARPFSAAAAASTHANAVFHADFPRVGPHLERNRPV